MSTTILTEMISYLVGALTGIGEGIGAALSTLVNAVFLQTTGTGSDAVTSLSAFGALICIFAGLSLAFGLVRWIVNLITSFGQRNR